VSPNPDPERVFRGWRPWLIGLGIWTLVGLLFFSYHYLDVLVRGQTEPIHEKLIEELTAAWGALFFAAFVVWLTWRLRGRGLAAVPVHLAALLAASAFHTTWNWATRALSYAVLGLGEYDYGIMRLRYLMELPNDAIWYVIFAILAILFRSYRDSRDRELRLAELEAEVSQVRLQALEARLQPHFLFNALNTVSAVMYEDVDEADRVLTRLGDLLRRSLSRDSGGEVSLAYELESLELYLAIIRARFGDRLTATVDAGIEVRSAALPSLLLQPIVENAVKHGNPGPGMHASITVRAVRRNGHLEVEVTDNGPGLAASAETAFESGIGLSTTRRRIERMYGAAGSLSLEPAPQGGLRVRLVIPWREHLPADR
jgi:signal transduction histidine kinase